MQMQLPKCHREAGTGRTEAGSERVTSDKERATDMAISCEPAGNQALRVSLWGTRDREDGD